MESWIRQQLLRQQNKILTALLEQIQSLLPQVEDQGNERLLKQAWLNLEKNLDPDKASGEALLREIAILLKSKNKSKRKIQ